MFLGNQVTRHNARTRKMKRIFFKTRILVIIAFILVAFILINYYVWNSNYMTKLHVSGKLKELIHNLLYSDNCNNTVPPHYPTHVMIVGGMSFIGARLGHGLKRTGIDVLVTEDIVNIDREPIKWYRWKELHKEHIDCNIYDYSSTDTVTGILKQHFPKVIVLVPTKLFSNYKDPIWKHLYYYDILRNTMSLLEAIKVKSVHYVLIVLPKGSKQGLTRSFEKILIAHILLFARETGIKTAIVSANNDLLYGPWQNDTVHYSESSQQHHIDTYVLSLIQMIKTNSTKWITPNTEDNHDDSTKKWITKYNEEKETSGKKDVVAGATLMFKYCYHCFFFTNSLDYIREWFISAVRYNLNVLLIHNSFSYELQDRLKSIHPSTEIEHAQCVNKKAATDQRFYILYNYLLQHSEINRIIFTDQRDVTFLNNPFEIMNGIGNDYLFVGHDFDRCIRSIDDNFIRKQIHSCFPQYSNTKTERELFYLAGSFNSGVLGGSRLTMLTLLAHMKIVFESTNARVCDMIAVGLPGHTKFYDIVYTLYPFNNGFDSKTPGPFGLAVKHKISMY